MVLPGTSPDAVATCIIYLYVKLTAIKIKCIVK